MRTPENRCVPVSEWPEADRSAWELALAPADPLFGASSCAHRWKPATRGIVEAAYGRWLGYLQHAGQLDPTTPAGGRADRDTVEAYHETLKAAGLAEYTIAGLIRRLGNALSAIDGTDWKWIKDAGDRLHATAQPRRDILKKMQRPHDVLDLARDLMAAADHDRFRTPCDRATLFRDGLILGLVTLRPFRRTNLTNLTLGQHLRLVDGTWWIHIPAEETKSGELVDCTWPAMLVEGLERYLDVHRNTLLQGARVKRETQSLWISRQGKAMTSDAIYTQIRLRTGEEFGEPINLHTFRHMAATEMATENPDEVLAVKGILGHGSLGASEAYYNKARVLGASERVQRSIDHHRRKARRR